MPFHLSNQGLHAGEILLRPVNVTNGAIVIHTQRLKSDPGGNLLS
ncbi:chemotaxis protein [Escherichia coli]|nr:chemotaxis protein [Escherichia coli]